MNWWPWILVAGAVIIGRRATRLKPVEGMFSTNFSHSEFIRPDAREYVNIDIMENLDALVDNVLQPARDVTGIPIRISSGLRTPSRNSAIGGVSASQHLYGQAADIMPIPATLENFKKLWDAIIANNKYDQIIWENAKAFTGTPSHLHVSYARGANTFGPYNTNRRKKLQYLYKQYTYI